MGRLTFGYKAPPQSQTPLVLQVFNPTFWVMVEMCMGAWAANLPVLTPVARGLSKRYKQSSLYKTLSNSALYKSLSSSTSSQTSMVRDHQESDLERFEGTKKDSSQYHPVSSKSSRTSG